MVLAKLHFYLLKNDIRYMSSPSEKSIQNGKIP